MRQNSKDSVFQLSLTEIALILAFLLLILLGMLYSFEKNKNDVLASSLEDANAKISHFELLHSLDILEIKFNKLKVDIESFLVANNITEVHSVIDDLISASVLESKLRDLEIKLAQLESSDSACAQLASVLGEDFDPLFFANLKEQSLQFEETLSMLRDNGYLVSSVADLNSHFFNNVNEVKRLQRQCGGGSIGPCWVDDRLRTQNLLNITLEPEHISVSIPNLPPNRMAEMMELPSIDLATRSTIPYNEFESSFGPILQWSRNRNPECRHYVSIRSNILLTQDSTPRRVQVQRYFYPDESSVR